ncbi:MAG: helix-turn-helix domain-containing protein [bacterium]|nr:helix-turn-helix domain-containing protein [bacterium]
MTEFERRQNAMVRYTRGENPTQICESLRRTKQWFYKWLKRYTVLGETGLKDQSKKPKSSPRRIPLNIEMRIVSIRRHLSDRSNKETQWTPVGADSIGWHLEQLYPGEQFPSRSTISRVVQRNGLITRSKKNTNSSDIPYPAPLANYPNAVHQFDTVGPRFINGTRGVEQFHSLHLADCYSRVVTMRQYEDTKSASLVRPTWAITRR